MFPYSVRMQENTNQKNFKYGHFLRSVIHDYLSNKKQRVNFNNTAVHIEKHCMIYHMDQSLDDYPVTFFFVNCSTS